MTSAILAFYQISQFAFFVCSTIKRIMLRARLRREFLSELKRNARLLVKLAQKSRFARRRLDDDASVLRETDGYRRD